MIAPIFSTTARVAGMAMAPLLAATTALCLSLETVKELLSKDGLKGSSEKLAEAGLSGSSHVPGG